MSYQVLARKWRPSKFSELVGQEHVVTAISHALDNDRLHHAYLFSGTRGVGKTTIARIFSKSLNCDEGQSAEPCGVCDTCKSIEAGNFVDLLEIDAASRTKVEDTRELLDNVQYKPTRGRYKVYLIDEVHMLSKHSFNALLKTLEEPPPHVKFLLATTDPQKLPVTILSRCLQFNLKALSREQIARQLGFILEQETISFEEKALGLLARAAQGSMRDALSLTDQAIAQGNNAVKQSIVTDMLGLMDKQVLLKLLQAVIDKDKSSILQHVEQLALQAPDYGQVLAELSSLLHQIALTQWEPEACKLETSSARAIFELAKRLSDEHVQLLYKLALEGIKELPFSVDGFTCLQMTLLRMTSFAPIPNSESSSEERRQIIEQQRVSSHTDDREVRLEQEAAPCDSNAESVEQSNNEKEQGEALSVGPIEDIESMDREQQQLEAQKLDSDDANASREGELTGIEKTQALLALRQSLKQPTAEPTQKKTTSKTFVEPPQPEKKAVPSKPQIQAAEPITEAQDTSDAPPPWVLDNSTETVTSDASGPSHVELEVNEVQEHTEIGGSESAVVSAPFLDNGDKLVHAKQVNAWSRLIEQSQLNGLDKQVALNATFSKQGNEVTLLVDKSQQHLMSDAATANIIMSICKALGGEISVQIELGEPIGTPVHIQRDIEHVRQQHAEKIVATDTHIQGLVNALDANIEHESIKAR